MKKLYFVRHGLSEMNVSGHIAGHTDTPLTDEGRAQAKQAGKQAKNLDIDYIVSSPLSRALETAQIIAKEIDYPASNIHINSLFIERNHGALEGTTWHPDVNFDGITDAETNDEILERALLAIEFLKSLEAKHILVVAHGGIGRAIRHHVTGPSFHEHMVKIQNATILQWI